MDILLIICTIMGGIAALCFFIDKARAIEWTSPKPPKHSVNIIQSGFSTYQKAVNSRFIAIDEYESKDFIMHEINW